MIRQLSGLAIAVAAVATAADPDPISASDRRRILDGIGSAVAARGKSAEYKTEVAAAEAALKWAKAGVIDKTAPGVIKPAKPGPSDPIRFPSADAKKKDVADLEERLKELKAVPGPVSDPLAFAPTHKTYEPGDFGKLAQSRVRVERVIDGGAVVAKLFRLPPGATRGQEFEAVVSGIDTSKMADATAYPMPGVFFVAAPRKIGGATLTQLAAVKFSDEELAALKKGK